MNRILTGKHLAERFGVERRTIDRWVSAGILPPPVKPLGARCFWNEAEVEAAWQRYTEATRASRQSVNRSDNNLCGTNNEKNSMLLSEKRKKVRLARGNTRGAI